MGLDMYLEKCNIRAWEYRHMDIDDIKRNKKLYEELSPYIVKRGKYMVWESLFYRGRILAKGKCNPQMVR